MLYRVDPTTGAATPRASGVAAGYAISADGAVWLGAFNFNSVFRVDWTTGAVRRLATGPGDQGPEGLAATPSGIWVANHHGGSITQLDPSSGAVKRIVQLVEPGLGGPQALAFDRSNVWVALAFASEVVEVADATGAILHRRAVRGGTCGGVAPDQAQVWIAADGPLGGCGSGRLSTLDRATGRVSEVAVTNAVDVAVDCCSVWALAGAPPRLVRVNPTTHAVIGSLNLPARGWNLAVRANELWVRVEGALLRVVPTDD
jgi:streptogramin lyase